MVIELFGKLVLDDLLEDDDKGGSQLPVLFGVFLDLVVVKIQSGGHYAWLLVAECLFQLFFVIGDFDVGLGFLTIRKVLLFFVGSGWPSS